MSLSGLSDLSRVFWNKSTKNIGRALWDKAIAGKEGSKLNHPHFWYFYHRKAQKNIQGHHSQVVNMTLWESIPGKWKIVTSNIHLRIAGQAKQKIESVYGSHWDEEEIHHCWPMFLPPCFSFYPCIPIPPPTCILIFYTSLAFHNYLCHYTWHLEFPRQFVVMSFQVSRVWGIRSYSRLSKWNLFCSLVILLLAHSAIQSVQCMPGTMLEAWETNMIRTWCSPVCKWYRHINT